MATYEELMAQSRELYRQAEELRDIEAEKALDEIAGIARKWGISSEAIAKKLGGHYAKKRTLRAKYRDPVSGAEWSGVGNPPAWARAAREKGKLEELRA